MKKSDKKKVVIERKAQKEHKPFRGHRKREERKFDNAHELKPIPWWQHLAVGIFTSVGTGRLIRVDRNKGGAQYKSIPEKKKRMRSYDGMVQI